MAKEKLGGKKDNICLSIDLPALVRAEQYPLRKVGANYASHICPACGESSPSSTKLSVFRGKDRWRFKCFVCRDAYGDAADFLALSRGITSVEALSQLRGLDKQERTNIVLPGKQPEKDDAEANARALVIKDICEILKGSANNDEPSSYLQARGINREVIDLAKASGQLRMLPINPEGARRWLLKHVGKSRLEEAGMCSSTHSWPALAFHPIIIIEPGGNGFECRVATFKYQGSKSIRYGRMKWPWYLSRRPSPANLLVTEGFIDAMSAWQLLPKVDAFLAIPGTNGGRVEWYKAFHAKLPQTEILLGLDTDLPGIESQDSLIAQLTEAGIPVSTLKPPGGKDWNDALRLSQDVFL